MSFKYNNFKDVLTDILGFAVFGLALYFIYTGKMEFLYEGLAMMVFGSLFFIVSDDGIAQKLTKLLDTLIKAIGKRISGSERNLGND